MTEPQTTRLEGAGRKGGRALPTTLQPFAEILCQHDRIFMHVSVYITRKLKNVFQTKFCCYSSLIYFSRRVCARSEGTKTLRLRLI